MEDSVSARSQGKMEFPKFGCVCELCDCGRHKHHKGCSKRNAEIRISWGSDSCPLSHYKATFTWPHKRKRSCKRLPLSLALGGKSLLSPQPRQTPGPSNQRVPKPLQCSSVQSLAPSPEEPGTPSKPGAIPQNGLRRHNTASSCYSYQHHRGAPRSNSFPRLGELPAVVGSLLYPDPREKMETTNNREFFAKTGGKPERKPVVQCSLTLEGERELATTHREQFKSHPIEGAPVVRRRQPPVKQEKGELRGPPMECITRYSHDFPPRQSLPEKRTPVLPRPDNLAINPALRQELR
ncbi:hypothetical protein AGOR_G00030750 [Albula goreensis]|uniref:Uncharacterized protein n=1 Tax=Albula goreensis TaxID=1534307 RepID=A0A8T3E329_9TELE|nr:hypothetical protein AGOR_G00030750 [Albula goreensis]